MKCPVDGATLLMSDRHGVEIDYCPDCRGVWLDRGELDKIIDRADDDDDDRRDAPRSNDRDRGSTQPQYQQPQYQQPQYGQPQYRQSYGHPHRKRKNMLSELFDFD